MVDVLAVGFDLVTNGVESILTVTEQLDGVSGELDVVLQNDDDDDSILPVIAGFFIGLFLIYKGVDMYRRSRLIKDTATERIRSMAVGRTELEGIAHEIDEPFDQPFTDGTCLYASWEIEEYTKDDEDDWSWDTVESGAYTGPFSLEDETGRVVVDATTDATWELSGELTRRWTTGSGSTPAKVISQFCTQQGISPVDSHKRRYTQRVLPPQTSVYVLGEATPRDVEEVGDMTDAGQRLKIERDEGSDRFIISDMGEEELASYYGKRAPLYVVGGLLLSAICLFIILNFFVG